MKKEAIFASLILLVLAATACAGPKAEPVDNEVVIYEFYGKGCPHCTKLNAWFDKIKPNYPTLKVIPLEVYSNQTNRKLFQEMAKSYGKKSGGVPAMFINDEMIVGFHESMASNLESKILGCLKAVCANPLEYEVTN